MRLCLQGAHISQQTHTGRPGVPGKEVRRGCSDRGEVSWAVPVTKVGLERQRMTSKRTVLDKNPRDLRRRVERGDGRY